MALAQRRLSKLLPLLLVLALGSPPALAAAPITHEDVWLMKRMGATAVSPDGRWIVMSVSEPAYDDAQKGSDLWIVPSDGSAPPRRLTSGKAAEGSPVFSPDSRRIAFVAKREGDDVSQIYVLELAGGEAQRVTNWPTGARSPLFSPDGRTMLFVSETFPGARTDEDNRKAAAERKARKYVARAYDSFPIRHWDRWLDELRPTLVVQSLDTDAPARDLLAGTTLRQGRGYGGRQRRRRVDTGRPRRRLCRNDESQRSCACGCLCVAVAGGPRWRRAAPADDGPGRLLITEVHRRWQDAARESAATVRAARLRRGPPRELEMAVAR
jgi:dipeptidyl aminopeptidase/acylaminoacyl peptidase